MTKSKSTTRAELEAELRATREELDRVKGQCEQQRLESGKTKRDFLANMSHELRTPLNGILGMTDLLRSTECTEEQRHYLSAVHQAGRDLLRIVNNLLDISNMESGKLTLRTRAFRLRTVLETIIQPFEDRAREKGLRFSYTVDADVPDVLRGDPDRLKQIFMNLLANAVKFTNSGEVQVRLGLWRDAETGQNSPRELSEGLVMLWFQVVDTGIGIPEQYRDAVFDSFVLVEELLTKKWAGAGLGLPIARHLAEAMGGDLWFNSTPGDGSEFNATVLCECAGKGDAPAAPPQRKAPKDDSSLRILLVEDEEVGRLFARLLLEKMGHTVLVAENGRRALDVLSREDVDLVLMDIQMPEMDGLSACRAIRAGGGVRNPAVPVVALTVFALQDDKKRAMEAGMDEYLTKPVDRARLERTIARVVSHKNEAGEAE